VESSLCIVLASGNVNRRDVLAVELHQPIGSPTFILVRWPSAPTVTDANPKALATIAASVVRLLGEAQARLATLK